MKFDIQLNDIVELKKEHPCGSDKWRVLENWSRLSFRMLRLRP